MTRVVTLGNRDTLETTHTSDIEDKVKRDVIRTDSERSIISKPFVQRMAILAFKKMRSYDSDGKKKSCLNGVHYPLGCGRGVYVLCKCGTTPNGVVADQIENSEKQVPWPSRLSCQRLVRVRGRHCPTGGPGKANVGAKVMSDHTPFFFM